MISLQHINKIFELGDSKVHALDDVCLEIQQGEYLSVMGPSGSGKSTLLNMIGLLDRPTSGQYQLKNIETTSLSEEKKAALRRDTIGFVFQSYHLISRLSAKENVELPLLLAGHPLKERRVMVEKLMQQLALTDRSNHLPKQLSGGQRQRVAIARAVVMHPLILLADEPTGNLDTASGKEVVNLLEQLNADGITLIVVTHDMDIGKRARRQIRMVDGAIVWDHKS